MLAKQKTLVIVVAEERRGERILNVNGDGCDRKKIAGRRIRRELKIRESEKLEDNNHNNSPRN